MSELTSLVYTSSLYTDIPMKCKLCKSEVNKLVKSHIAPKAFFKNMPDQGRFKSRGLYGDRGRVMPSGIYDRSIPCQVHEHDIFEPLDDYAAKILKHKTGVSRLEMSVDGSMGVYIFADVDKKLMMNFIACFLWRASVSGHKELDAFKLRGLVRKKIERYLQRNLAVDFLDATVSCYSHDIHNAFRMPFYAKSNSVQARHIQLPKIHIVVAGSIKKSAWW